MVWKFIDTNNPEGKAESQRIHKQIKKWWQTFQKDLPKIVKSISDPESDWDLDAFFDKHLQAINPNLTWDIDNWGEGFCLCLTANGERYLQPLVESIVASAPAIDQWTFFPERMPDEFSELNDMLKEATGISLSQMMFQIEPFEGNTFALVYSFQGATKISEDTLNETSAVTGEVLLGEKLSDRWISRIAVEHNDSVDTAQSAGFHHITELPNMVLAQIQDVVSKLPNNAIFRRKDELQRRDFSLEPEKNDDYPERLDMMAASSLIPEVWKAAHGDVLFDSARFSKHGERFCYLKMDGTDSYANSAQSRDRLSKTLDERLIEAQLGCTTGGAGGLRYSYIDLVLTDVDKAIPIIKDVMKYEHMPVRSWLLFFDVEWSREWVGLFEDTPAPPMMPHPFSVDGEGD